MLLTDVIHSSLSLERPWDQVSISFSFISQGLAYNRHSVNACRRVLYPSRLLTCFTCPLSLGAWDCFSILGLMRPLRLLPPAKPPAGDPALGKGQRALGLARKQLCSSQCSFHLSHEDGLSSGPNPCRMARKGHWSQRTCFPVPSFIPWLCLLGGGAASEGSLNGISV